MMRMATRKSARKRKAMATATGTEALAEVGESLASGQVERSL